MLFLFDKFDSERQNVSWVLIILHIPSRWIRGGKSTTQFYDLEIKIKIDGFINAFMFNFSKYNIIEPE
jgi:hypothetical protein